MSKASLSLRDEGLLLPVPRNYSELEVQARWFSGEFGTEFITTGGDHVRILQLGVWNREAGPDFAEAAISLNGGAPLRGCIELDPDARDWERHGHSSNPDYESVILHLFWKESTQDSFTRTATNRCVPQVLLKVENQEPAPVQNHSKPGRCSHILRQYSESKVKEIIEAASRFRLAKKSARLARLADIHGPNEALYQSLAVALGYKSNKLPFALLSQRTSLGLLQKNRADADALLFGVAGFIDSTDLSRFDSDTRIYLRRLWERWWSRRSEFQRMILSKNEWRFNGLRPANDPHRRVAALLEIVRHWPEIRTLAKACDVGAIRRFFATLGKAGHSSCVEDLPSSEFWRFHYSFNSARTEKSMALVGGSRVDEMLANVFFPIAIHSEASLWNAFKQLPSTLSNSRVQTAVVRLFGSNQADHLPFLRNLVYQQGLLQIYEDFCCYDASDCACCPFPEQCAKLPLGGSGEFPGGHRGDS